jgi:cell division control protein 6
VLRSETYLTTDFEPEKPVGRQAEINRIADAVKPVANRKPPESLIVQGRAGVGKTQCVKHVFQHLEDETRVKSIYINC